MVSTLLLLALTWTDQVAAVMGSSHIQDLLISAGFVAYSAVGALILLRRPGNRVGRILLASGLCFQLWMFSARYAAYGLVVRPGSLPGAETMAWIFEWLIIPAFGLSFAVLLLVYPDGRLPSPRWRPVAWLAVAALAFTTFTWATNPGALGTFDEVTNPIGVEMPEGIDSGLGWLLMLLALLTSAASLIVRYLRSAGVERLQIRWLAYAGALMVLTLMTVTFASSFEPVEGVADFLFPVAIAALPVAVGIAILRYRLYDIDHLINRTLVYTIVVGFLVAFYSAVVVSIPSLLQAIENRDLLVAAATLVVFFLFNPLRRRVQRFVDRRFYRSRYNAQQVVDQFAARLRDQIDLDVLTEEWLAVVDETVKPETAYVWVR